MCFHKTKTLLLRIGVIDGSVHMALAARSGEEKYKDLMQELKQYVFKYIRHTKNVPSRKGSFQ